MLPTSGALGCFVGQVFAFYCDNGSLKSCHQLKFSIKKEKIGLVLPSKKGLI